MNAHFIISLQIPGPTPLVDKKIELRPEMTMDHLSLVNCSMETFCI